MNGLYPNENDENRNLDQSPIWYKWCK